MLMVESVSNKKPPVVEAGKSALELVVSKLKRLFIPLLSAELILVVINRLVMYNENVFSVFLKTIPDLTGINNSGILIAYNGPTWYISAMLIMMLPLCWLLIKHRDFFIYVFAPLFCVLSLGYMYNQENPLVNVNDFYGIVVGGILRAFSGLCAGVISWLICSKLRKITGRNLMIVLTILEIICWVSIIFITITQLKKRDNQLVYIYMLMMIPLVAIVFSKKSFISRLFRFEFMRSLGRISLLIYLNHELAKRIVLFYFPGQSYGASVALMAAFTVAIIVAALLLEFLLKATIKMIKPMFLKGGFENDTKV